MPADSKVVAGNLPLDISKEELNTVFSTYGEVSHIEILPGERHGGKHAEISYIDAKAGEDAIQVLHDVYKIRENAEHPIQVWWGKTQESSGGNTGGSWGASGEASANGGQEAQGSHAGSGGGSDSREKIMELADKFKLFVGGLPDDITEDEIKTVFGNYGDVVHIHIMKANSMTGLRAAFVYYSQKESAEDAIKVLNEIYKIRTNAEAPIQVRWGKDNSSAGGKGGGEEINKIFVGNLPPDLTEDELKTVFGTYGELTNVKLMDVHAKSGLRAALVFYVKKESGEEAIKLLNEVYKFREDSEQAIQVKWGKDKEQQWGKGGKGWSSGGWGSNSWNSGDSWNSGGKGGKGGKGGGWQALGNGNDWKDRGSSWGGNSGWQDRGNSGWQDRSSSWQDDSWKSGSWNSGGSWGKGGGKDKGGKDWGKDSGKGGKGEEPTGKLHVANLPMDIAEKDLEYVFSTYGKVEKVHIMSNNNKNGAVAAFVHFNTPEEAETAIASLHNYEIREGYGPIQVKHAFSRPRPRPY